VIRGAIGACRLASLTPRPSRGRAHAWRHGVAGLMVLAAGLWALTFPVRAQVEYVDTALVVAVDVSNSVNDERYRLQMEGLAAALEDPGVIAAVQNGPNGAILFSVVAWSDQPEIVLGWHRIGSKEDALLVAAKIRRIRRYAGEFTCMARMLRFVTDKVLTQLPARALRSVVDVSGDGPDNCNPRQPVAEIRDELVGYRTIVNGLPIMTGDRGGDVVEWYRRNVKGGPGSFILPADGFGDFGRAIRQKFIVEISWREPDGTYGHGGQEAAMLRADPDEGEGFRLAGRDEALEAGPEPSGSHPR